MQPAAQSAQFHSAGYLTFIGRQVVWAAGWLAGRGWQVVWATGWQAGVGRLCGRLAGRQGLAGWLRFSLPDSNDLSIAPWQVFSQNAARKIYKTYKPW